MGLNAKSYIATRDIKVRAGKNIHAKIIGTVKNRATVDVTEIDDVWWRVTYNDQDGYVQGKYLKEDPQDAQVSKETEQSETRGLPFGLTSTQLGIFIIVGLAAIVIIRQIRNYITRRKARMAYRPPVDRVVRPTHWYQCKHCSAAIKKDSEPGIAGCSQSLRHLWINLGELGNLKYICQQCSTIVTVKEEPATDGCPNSPEHQWKKIGK